jgi:hypothetical protein
MKVLLVFSSRSHTNTDAGGEAFSGFVAAASLTRSSIYGP